MCLLRIAKVCATGVRPLRAPSASLVSSPSFSPCAENAARGAKPCTLLIEIAVVANRRHHWPVRYLGPMLIDGLYKARLRTSGRSLPHPLAPPSSLRASSFRSCLGGAQSIAYRHVWSAAE